MNVMRKQTAALLAVIIMALSLSACKDKTPVVQDTAAFVHSVQEETDKQEEPETGELVLAYEEELAYATRFTLSRYVGGYSMFSIPEIDERKYLIVPEGKAVPENLPDHTVILKQPVERICFASGSMASLAEVIGALDRITTVAIDIDGWSLDAVAERMKSGEILYSGSYKEPDYEMLLGEGIQLEIDSTMLVGYPEVGKKYDELGIPYFIEDSSKETHPLGRMEWVKLLGAILGRDEAAKNWFEQQTAKINALETMEKSGKTAALFYIGEKGVYVRNSGDYIAMMLELAGGEYVCKDMNPEQGGNTKMDFEEFYMRCRDADYLFWIVLACPHSTLEELVDSNELFADFKAVQEGNVYSSRRGFAQRTADLADVVTEMHAILENSGMKETETFIKLK